MTALDNIFLRHDCDKSNNSHCYTEYYESILNPHPEHLLEIGMYEGSSLKSWWEYLPDTEIYGIDDGARYHARHLLDPVLELPSIHHVFGDSTIPETALEMQTLQPFFDVIIDDGSHFPKDQLTTFRNFFPLLKPNGIYVIEDVHPLHLSGAEDAKHGYDVRKDEFTKEYYENTFLPPLYEHGQVSFYDCREKAKLNGKRYGLDSYIVQVVKV